MYHISRYHYFFFQAVDGIRDGTVTGVQTCALPICVDDRSLPREPAFLRGHSADESAVIVECRVLSPRISLVGEPKPSCSKDVERERAGSARTRSEERRVGKEGRGRWEAGGRRKKKR